MIEGTCPDELAPRRAAFEANVANGLEADHRSLLLLIGLHQSRMAAGG